MFASLLMGITFSVYLMTQMTSMFAGMMKKASSTVVNTGAKMWVMDRSVTSLSSSIPLPDYMLDAVRSIQDVRFAVPFYMGAGLAKLKRGTYQAVTVIGLDDTSLFGRPAVVEGRLDAIYAENAL
jgi:putative ABC transport system permease protein